MKFKFIATFVVAFSVLFGVGCGGGGGGSAPTPTPTPVPVTPPSGNVSVAPSSCQISAGLGKCTATVTFATANATTASLVATGGAVLSSALSGSLIADVFIGTNIFSLSADGKVVATVMATGVCATGTTSNGTECVAPVTWWPPKNAIPNGTKVTSYYQLPVGCDLPSLACFHDAIAAGMPATGGGTDSTGKAVIWLGFISATGNWYVAPFFVKDGTWAGLNIHGGPYNTGTAMWGTADGVITRDATDCYKTVSDKTLFWKTDPVTCPL